jgi:hypothetical protein
MGIMDKIYYLTYVVGLRGVGKTSLLAHFATEYMKPDIAFYDLLNAQNDIKKMQDCDQYWLFLKIEPQTKHLVYVVDDIFYYYGEYEPRQSIDLQFERLGLPDGESEVDYILPYAKIFIPEIQAKLDSRKSLTKEKITDNLLRYLERQRKFHHQMFADAQIFSSVDKRFRSLADRIIKVLNQKHKYKDTEIISTTWECLEFYDKENYERYESTGEIGNGTKTRYTHYGDIFMCFDSFYGREYYHYLQDKNYLQKLAEPFNYSHTELWERVEQHPLFTKKECG